MTKEKFEENCPLLVKWIKNKYDMEHYDSFVNIILPFVDETKLKFIEKELEMKTIYPSDGGTST